jgi:sugar phosphate isomerase/epimerase
MRSVLYSAAIVLAALATSVADCAAQPAPRLNYAAMNKLGWKLSCQAWTFRELTLFETIDTLKSLGIRYIEMFPGQRVSKDEPVAFNENAPAGVIDQVIEKCRAAGVTPVCYGVTGIPADEAGARKLFDFAKKLGLLNLVAEPAENQFDMIDKLCNEYKINVAIHDHPKPSHYWDPDTVLKVCEGRSLRIGSCADTGHWRRSGLDPVECLRKLKGRIISLHFKDLDAKNDDVPWGTGVCNAAGQLEELKKQGFKGVFSIEYERTSGQELIDNVRKCVVWFSAECSRLAKSR